MIKSTLPLVAVLALGALSSCEKKSEEIKKVEATTAAAVESGEITKEQAKEVNKAAEKIDDVAQDAKKEANDMLEKLNKATTGDEIKEIIRETSKTQLAAMVKAGQMTQEQADQMLVNSETSLNALTEEQLKAQVEQVKQMLEQVTK